MNDGDARSRAIGIRDWIAGTEHDHLRFLVELCLRWFVANLDYATNQRRQMREEYAANLARIKRGDVVFVACGDGILHRPGTDIEQVRLTLVNDGDARSGAIGIRDGIAGAEHDHLRFLVELCLR